MRQPRNSMEIAPACTRVGLLALPYLLCILGCGPTAGGPDTTPGDGPLVPPQGCDAQDDDGDGFSNAVETAMGTSPTDPHDNPDTRHQIVFAMPYHGAARPAAREVAQPARVARADVAVLLDTTGSMNGTDNRIQAQFQQLVTMLAGQIDDLAFGAAGFGDFPVYDGANSDHDVPFYLVHRMMTVRTPAGLQSVIGALTYHNIIVDGVGPWFAGMRGGDEPEQGWEALRQMATGVGITYPSPFGGVGTVPPFHAATAYPPTLPAGEERGTLGGLGFRKGSLPIIVMVTDTTMHTEVLTTTTPQSASRAVALQALTQLGARVIGVKTFFGTGQTDLQAIADQTGAHVAPNAWGVGAARPANCPVGHCCLIADDPPGTSAQPLPTAGECSLVFQSDKYDTNLARMIAQAVTAVARGVRFDASATMIDDPSDTVEAVTAFVDHVEAVTDGTCAGGTVRDHNGDGVPDTFEAVVPGTDVCFRITARVNDSVPPGEGPRRFRAMLQLTGNGLADLTPREVWFVVPATACEVAPPCVHDSDCPTGETCNSSGQCGGIIL